MKIAIITAMKEEADHIIGKYDLKKTKTINNLQIFENENLVLALSGIGKIQSTFATTYVILNYEVKNIVNIGIAGSLMGKNASIGDVFLVNKISQHDMYLPFEGEHLDYAKKEIVINNGLEIDFSQVGFSVTNNAYCLTGDQFIDDENKVLELSKKFGGNVIEMEAFGVASVCRELGYLDKSIFIKAISDGADNDAKLAHMGNLDFAMKNSIIVLDEVLKNL